MRYLITGGCGFIGSNLIIHLTEKYGDSIHIHNLDALTYAGNLANLNRLKSNNYEFSNIDTWDRESVEDLFDNTEFDVIIHLAAESHVDRSIDSCGDFLTTNVIGTQNMLDMAVKYNVHRFIHVSTDEVYGELADEGCAFSEDDGLYPNSPYSASKAASDLLVRSYMVTYGLKAVITRCSNNYGPYQHPEKLIPKVIINALNDKKIPVYAKGINIRDWIHVSDHCKALDILCQEDAYGTYNIGGNNQIRNIDIVDRILTTLGKPESLIEYVEDRKGHDYRYDVDYSKINEQYDWEPKRCIDEALEETVDWYKRNQKWVGLILGE